jgi:hypothetical protein
LGEGVEIRFSDGYRYKNMIVKVSWPIVFTTDLFFIKPETFCTAKRIPSF